jgi:glycosyltransferase involved in cell wall biosynthesis
MKIMHVITRFILGGAQENTLSTVLGLMHSGRHEVILVTGPAIGPEGDLLARAMRSGVNTRVLPHLRRAICPYHDVLAFVSLARVIREFRPDVVHTHSSKAGVLGRLAARLLRVPVIVHTIHGLPFHPHQNALLNRVYILLERWCARYSDKLITVADAMASRALAARIGRPGLYRTIYSGLELDAFLRDYDRGEVRRKYGLSTEDLVIGKIARLSDLKGHEYLFDAFEEVASVEPRAKLVLIGDGRKRRRYERRVAESGLSGRVVFAGLIPPEEVPPAIQAMDLVVHTSLREGLARVLVQALVSGVPVISYDVDGAREVVIPEETGMLLPPKEVRGLAAAILRLLASPEQSG